MNEQALNTIADLLRQRVAGLDVRADQCDLLRVHAGDLLIAIRSEPSGGFTATGISIRNECDYESEVAWVVRADSIQHMVDEVVRAVGNSKRR